MKRILVFCLVLAMTLTLFTGCKGKGNVSDTNDGKVDGTNGSAMTEPAASGGSTATSTPMTDTSTSSTSSTSSTHSSEASESGMTIPGMTDETTPVKPAKVTEN